MALILLEHRWQLAAVARISYVKLSIQTTGGSDFRGSPSVAVMDSGPASRWAPRGEPVALPARLAGLPPACGRALPPCPMVEAGSGRAHRGGLGFRLALRGHGAREESARCPVPTSRLIKAARV